LQGLCYLFEESIIHSDIRVDNILVQQSGDKKICKIADFGKGSILVNDGLLDLKLLPYGYSAVPNYLLYSTYFRDLHGWFVILLNLYCDFNKCDVYTSRQTILYPINFGSETEKKLIQLFYELQKSLLTNGYKGDDNTIHREILNNRNHYELKDDCITLISNDVEDELPPLPSGTVTDADNELPPLQPH
jgi:serine/threonine protein kinase